MRFSLNEVEGTAKRAARGAGYSWGMAEEAAKATRFLCAHGLDGCGLLAGLLDRVDGADLRGFTPRSIAGEWAAASKQLCPVSAGAALSDHAALLPTGKVAMRGVLFPALVLPFAAAVARHLETPVAVEWDGARILLDGSDMELSGDAAAPITNRLSIARGGAIEAPVARSSRAAPDARDWAELNRFAHRTYAPATEASRLLGAGTALSDND